MKFALFLAPATLFQLVSASPVKDKHEAELVSILNINPIEQDGIGHVYDYSLKPQFQDLPRPLWLGSWNYLMFNTLGEKKYDIKVNPEAEDNAIAHQLLFSLASGFSVETWNEAGLQKRFERANLENMMNLLWDTGDVSAELLEAFPREIERQTGASNVTKRYINKVSELRWNYHSDNRARVSSLTHLKNNLDSKNGAVMRYSRSAVCETLDNWRGCLSWTGGGKEIRSNVAAHAVWSAIDGFPDDGWVSARAHDGFHDKVWNHVYWKDVSFHVCVSNRPNGC